MVLLNLVSNMFKQILQGNKISNVVFIYDSSEESGFSLLKAFAEENLNRKNNIFLYCFENKIQYTVEALGCKGSDLVIGYDGFSNPLKWVREAEVGRSLKPNEQFCDVMKGDVLSDSKNNIVIIDSLSNAIIFRDIYDICRELNSIKLSSFNKNAKVLQVIALVHQDMCDYTALEILNHVASTNIITKRSISGKSVLHISHKTASGKITSADNYYWFDQSGVLIVEEELKDVGKQKCKDNDVIKNLTTFKLSLDETEKVARSKVVLPYLSVRNKAPESIIVYEPDQNDDWDDEDPDDDLDV